MKYPLGFTLLEVLVALAVLAIAMGAIIGTATQSVNTVGYLRDQTFAGWVAVNKVNELLLLDAQPWPNEGSRKGVVELANRTWRWDAEFQKTDDPDMQRLDLSVRTSEDSPVLSTVTAFKSRRPADDTSKGQASPEQADRN